jgi:cellulose biosynthesis protein BcsQ
MPRKLRAAQSRTADPVTLYEVLRPITLGESAIKFPRAYLPKSQNTFGVDLLPGDPRLALLEDKLSQAWLELSGGDIGGARQTNWNTQLCEQLDGVYDLVFYDVGPSLGALNRSVLLGVDYFVVPMGCDVFSLFGVSNIAEWLRGWTARYERSIEACKGAGFESEIAEFAIREDTESVSRFIGYTVQQYITKSRGGVRRATASFEAIRSKVPLTVQTHLGRYMAPQVDPLMAQLPDIPHMFSLVPLAQSRHSPIHRLTGLSGGQPAQKDAYSEFIAALASAIVNNAGIER